MEKSNIEKLKEALLYAPVGAFGFAKDNAPTFFNIFVNRGKRDFIKTTQNAEEKISTTKEHGQIVAMGTPIAKSKAESIAYEAKNKGEDLAHVTIDLALGAVGIFDSVIKSVTSSISSSGSAGISGSSGTKSATAHPTNLSAAASVPTSEQKSEYVANLQETPIESPPIIIDKKGPTFVPSEFIAGEGNFIAEPVDKALPIKIRAEYAKLSAPEIIDRLDEFQTDDLTIIKEHEAGFRNRQTIIHAINYRLTDNS